MMTILMDMRIGGGYRPSSIFWTTIKININRSGVLVREGASTLTVRGFDSRSVQTPTQITIIYVYYDVFSGYSITVLSFRVCLLIDVFIPN